jgi:hypothetical protein
VSDKLTAATITDEQIRDLRDSARGVDWDTYRLADTALADVQALVGQPSMLPNSPMAAWVREIRARCAEILNARKGIAP